MKNDAEYTMPSDEGDQESLILFDRQGLSEKTGATPLEPNILQQKVFDDLRKRFIENRPGGLSDTIFDYMLMHFENRFAKRQQRNRDSYLQRLYKDTSVIESEYPGLLKLALHGLAYPDELLDVRQGLGMGDIELGRVTHPFGEHIDDFEELRTQVVDAIVEKGGRAFLPDEFTGMEAFEVEDTDRRITQSDTVSEAFLIVRTRIVGVLPDQTEIHERSSFILQLDKAFDKSTVAKLKEVVRGKGESLHEQVAKVISITDVARPLLESNNFEAAIPLSSTMFALNGPLKEKIKQQIINSIKTETYPQSFLDAFENARKNVERGNIYYELNESTEE